MEKVPKQHRQTPGLVMAVCSCRLDVAPGNGVVAASQRPGDNQGTAILTLTPHPFILPRGIPRSLLDPKPRVEKPFCSRSAPLGLGLFSLGQGLSWCFPWLSFLSLPFPFEGEGFMWLEGVNGPRKASETQVDVLVLGADVLGLGGPDPEATRAMVESVFCWNVSFVEQNVTSRRAT